MVAAGVTLREPLEKVEEKPPGVIFTVFALSVDHLRTLLAPVLMLAGSAVNDVTVGPSLFDV